MAFKMKGSPMKRNFGIGASSPIKSTGIFDAQGNRISMDDALALEKEGEGVLYTEDDAIKKAQQNYDAATTDAEKKLWQKEIDEQKRVMEERKSSPETFFGGGTYGEEYTKLSEADQKLQNMVNSGEYAKLSPEEKAKLEAGAGRLPSRLTGGFYHGGDSKQDFAEFPTRGQISQTKDRIGELKDLGIIE